MVSTNILNKLSESIAEAILEATDNGILIIDTNRNVVKYNARFVELWNIPLALQNSNQDKELLDFVLDQLSAPQQFIDKVIELYNQPEAQSLDTIKFKDNRIFERFSRPMYLDGEVVARVWSFRDITLTENVKHKLNNEIGFRKTIIQILPDLIWLKDPNGVYLACNKRFEDFFGAPEAEIIGKTDYDFVNSELVETTKTPMYNDNNELIGVLGISHDITERMKFHQKLNESSQILEGIIETTLDGFWIVDNHGSLLDVNSRYCTQSGYTRDELLSMNISQLDAIENTLNIEERMKMIFEQQRLQFETKHRHKDGSIWDVEISVSNLDITNKRMFVFLRDITERKKYESITKQQKEELEAMFKTAKEGIAVLDMESNFLDFNEAYLQMTGFEREELLSTSCVALSAPEDRERTIDAMKTAIETGFLIGFEKICIVKNGKRLFINMTATVLPDKKRILITTKNMTKDHEHQQELQYMTHYDVLTELPNRVLNSDRLRQAMIQAVRRNEKIAVLYLDLDGFKDVNDRYGHSVGDKLLVALSVNMKQALREGDTLSRLGGDEFVAILVDMDDASISLPIIHRLLNAASQPTQIEDIMVQVSVSIGATFYPQHDDVDADQLIRQADQAMYEAKQSGKNRYHIFDSEHDQAIRTRHENLDRIRQALVNNEFVLYYQPKINMRTNAIVGAEALIRWQDPEKGLIPPLEFLPVIENHKLAVEVGEWVINEAVCQIQQWHKQGLHLTVSVNIGSQQLLQGDFIERLQWILAKHKNFDTSFLEIEVLETSALEDINEASQIITASQALGIDFSLDDFGTGYSSLTYLKQLPVKTLKIDQSFVRDMLVNSDDLAILEGVIGLAKVFDRKVIAEGVETHEHGQKLLLLGCELAQGYGVARPMPAEQLIQWAKKWEKEHKWIV